MERIADIIESIANEKNLPVDAVSARVAMAMTNTAKRIYGEKYEFFVDENTLKLYQKIVVLHDDDERISAENEHYMALSKAKLEAPDVEVGDELTYEIELEKLGRTAVNTLHKELEYHIQKLLEESVMSKYKGMEQQMVFGAVVRVDDDENTYVEIEEIRAVLPRKNRIKGEKFKVGNVIKAVIRRVFADKGGIRMELTRTSPKFLEALLRAEVPEIKDGSISIINAARIPGERAKIILKANAANIDPVGATVGQKGVRINAVSKELHNENIDCIEHCDNIALLISRALAPAAISSVKIVDIVESAAALENGAAETTAAALDEAKNLAENSGANGAENSTENAENGALASENLTKNDASGAKNLGVGDENSSTDSEKAAKVVNFRDKREQNKPTKKAIVMLNADQKSKAIGKNGINIRLAAMLTGCEIELQELGGKIIGDAIKDAMNAASKPLGDLDALGAENPLDNLSLGKNPLDDLGENPLDKLSADKSSGAKADSADSAAKSATSAAKVAATSTKPKTKDEMSNEEAMKKLESLFKD